MPLSVPKSSDDLLPAAQVRARYGVSDMTIYRWLTNKRLSFPKPIRINGRRYWRVAELQAFEVWQARKQEAA
ncbi:Prophage CP4-57 regulatory [Methylobacterium sp. 4-46]|uniref:helix-turn-helix transcriptional regulator n=1 Tax=unclassified Methylobacterium TaxID=2615210 RepID=UPI000165CCD5|nr:MULTISPECIES: helix-turn-helix domain-containing protein [Methylobacterium]ACA20973.1 Prophage CP4-57 regulatory [Methylobacterium sp. 4-46]WFT80129.1 AlpA family phage regulatory protein [Methylobacterium nodulans]